MADEKVTTILDVQLDVSKLSHDLGEATRQVQLLKQEQKLLNKALADGTISEENYGKAMSENSAELEKATRTSKGLTAQLKMLTKQSDDYGSSLNEQRRKLSDMQKAYDELDATVRDSKAGEKFLKEIQAQDAAVKKMEEATGRAQRSVGNYGRALEGLKRPFAVVKEGMNVLAAHPLIAVLGLLATLLMKLAERFRENGAAMEKLTGVFGAFHGIGVIVDKLIDKIADGVGWLAKKLYELADRFHLVSDEMKESKAIYEEELKLHEKRRALLMQEADTEREVAELRNKVAQKDKYTSEERLNFLQKAIDKEKAIAAERKRIAQEEYDLIVRRNAQSNSSQENLDKEAQAYAKLQAAETEYLQTTIRLQSQAAALAIELRDEAIAAAAEQEKLNNLTEEFLKNSTEQSVAIDESLAKMQEYREDLLALSEEEEEAYVQPLTAMQQRIAELKQEGYDFATAQKIAAAETKAAWAGAAASIAGGLGNAFTAASDLLAEYGEENEAAATASKAFAMAGVLASEAETIANGIKGVSAAVAAGAGVPFPANLAAIVTGVTAVTSTIAGVIAGITQAKQILSQDAGKFATGGVVGGNSYTGDKLIAHVNSAEGIYTPTQANNILQEIANNPLRGGVDYSAMADTIAAAVSAQPAPVLVLQELRKFEQKVTTFNELARV